MIEAKTLNSCPSIPGRPLGNDEIAMQIEVLTEKSQVSVKPGHIAEREIGILSPIIK